MGIQAKADYKASIATFGNGLMPTTFEYF